VSDLTADPEIRLDGEVAIVTGAGNGLGRAYAHLLASRGAKVVVNDIGQRAGADGELTSSADLVVKEIADQGGTAVAHRASVANREGGADLAQTALDAFGRIDVLVNNAGNIALTSFLKLDLGSIDSILDVHLRGAFYVTQPCYRQMVKQQYGRIVLTTSGVGLLGNGGVSTYGAAKGGVFGLLQVLKLEGAKHGIAVNAVAPMASTRLTVDVGMPQYLQLDEEEVTPELVAPVVGYFAGRDCPFTGEVWSVGSGSVARLFIARTQGYFKHPTLDGRLTVEDVAANVDRIRDETGYTTPTDWPAEWAEVVDLVTGAGGEARRS
jgi:NAD(P)-dependent dehydrogenase (short-subunit alcohol dehydrogenase family)